jgi:hypothetical protein
VSSGIPSDTGLELPRSRLPYLNHESFGTVLSSAAAGDISGGLGRGKLGEYLTKDSGADEACTGFGACHKNVQLSSQLFALGAILLRFASDASH